MVLFARLVQGIPTRLNTTTNIGFGWVHKNDTSSDLNISFLGGTSLSPSSSKAEAYAILMVVPPDSVVKINELCPHFSTQSYLSSAHSGDLYNDLADLEAGKGLDASPITINPQFIPDEAMIPMWDCIGPIDRDIRKFCQTITDAITFDSFTSNNKL
ncbi:hypothetical protein RhiirA4_454396 [Rhizophagus irregularis]|uniref:Uncharacterized protein n=1 Tax=Rhizophagus irregularis TaxID=588596 RepID=A0A2I1G2R6_9GLOM|nr:hypothetical protein RhiirA4_454396 [Rhizophagus irregularis]